MSRSNFDGLPQFWWYLVLGLFTGAVYQLSSAAPIGISQAHKRPEPRTEQEAPQQDDLTGRSERSPILLTGTARRIQMFLKNRHLQIMPDGVVNGTTDDSSIYTVLQRTTVGIGQVKIQGVATCHYLCMAGCGLLYSSKYFGDDCVFRETIEQSNYNTYCSRKYSTEKRTFYLALNRRGQSRKVVVRIGNQLGKLASFVRVLTRTVPEAQLTNMREQIHTCSQQGTDVVPKSKQFQLCPKRKKRKKKSQTCLSDMPNQHCQRRIETIVSVSKCEDKKCFKTRPKGPNAKRIHSDAESGQNSVMRNKNDLNIHEIETSTSLLPTTAEAIENVDEDYVIDPGVHIDWEGSTLIPSTTQVPKSHVI